MNYRKFREAICRFAQREKLMTPYSFLFLPFKVQDSGSKQILCQFDVICSEILEKMQNEEMTRPRDLDYHIVGAEDLN